jgi:hypothetical protein
VNTLAKSLSPEDQVQFAMKAMRLVGDGSDKNPLSAVAKPLATVLRRKLPFSPQQILELVELGAKPTYYYPFAQIITLAASQEMTPQLNQALQAMAQNEVLRHGLVPGHKQLLERINELLSPTPAQAEFKIHGNWSRAIAGDLTPALRAILESGAEISGSEPSKKWRDAAADRISETGRDALRETALRWLSLGPNPGGPEAQVDSHEADCQRGLLWSLTSLNDAEVCTAVARFAEGCLRKIPMLGAVSQKSGNACVKVLAAMDGMDAVSQLSRLSMRVKYQTAQRLVQESLDEAAARQGISRDELAEITVPSFDLDQDGLRRDHLGDAYAVLTATGGLSFEDPSGRPLKTVPASTKRDFADELKALKQTAKEIGVMASAHRLRIERLLLTQREIPMDTWRNAYIDHPLIARLGRALIWHFASGETAIWNGGQFLSWNGAAINPTGPVRLWHPLNSDVQTALSWRCWLEDNRLEQPFKQAHREVYVLTAAERESRASSRRFSGHILKQHQFSALAAQRGWHFRLMGEWDSHNTPYLDLPAFNLRVEYEVDFPEDPSVSGHAVYLYIATGAIHFLDPATRSAKPLDQIPPVVFSEAMRDIDLFVGVCSIGNDPAWTQQPQAPFGHYWNEFSFGPLPVLAQTRRETLQRLMPSLAIRARCTLEDRWLRVRGDLADYKIHLGSASVLIEPGSRYLCIVRGPSAGVPQNVFLPFEGDGMLSLILSKAFLLANDTKIKDPAITSQLPAKTTPATSGLTEALTT